MKKYKINKWWQIVERDETDDGSAISVNPWFVRLICVFLVLIIAFKFIRFLLK